VDRINADLQTMLSNGDDMYQLIANIKQSDRAYLTLLSIRQSIQANQESTDASFQQQIAALQPQISALGG
jgi:hypothetical protein